MYSLTRDGEVVVRCDSFRCDPTLQVYSPFSHIKTDCCKVLNMRHPWGLVWMIDFLFHLIWRTTSSISNHWKSHLMPLLCKNINVATNKLESSPTRSLKSIHPRWYPSETSPAPEQGSLVNWKHVPLLEVNTWTLPEPAHFARLLKHSHWSFPCNLSKTSSAVLQGRDLHAIYTQQ